MTQMKKMTILSEERDAEQLELSDIAVEIQNTLKHSVAVYKNTHKAYITAIPLKQVYIKVFI